MIQCKFEFDTCAFETNRNLYSYYMKIALIILFIIVWLLLIIIIVLHTPMFGSLPAWDRLNTIKESHHFSNWAFQNEEYTPSLTNGATVRKLIKQQLSKPIDITPTQPLQFTKTDLHSLDMNKNQLIWFWHSSYLIILDGKKILVDPVLSNHASPFPWVVTAFAWTSVYTADDFPEIDLLIITHDHRDHLDYKTLRSLQPKIKQVITWLWVWAHLSRRWYSKDTINEWDWGDQLDLWSWWQVTRATSRHFSWRWFKRDQSLWSSFVLQSPTQKLYLWWDSWYGKHFTEIGQKYWPFDLAILECWQYNTFRSSIHMTPEETLQAAHDLQAKQLLPVHRWKFALSLHSWHESVDRLISANSWSDYQILTPWLWDIVELDWSNDTTHRRKNLQ